tara:strand:- start:85 stop:486 length:402 start_codon:yes stop_codon:yes gene_type:complete
MQAKEFKTMVLGPRCGKTMFINHLVRTRWGDSPLTTVGVQVTPYDVTWEDERYRLNLWEVGSKYQGLGKDYGRDMDLAIIFMDNTNDHETYERWIPRDVPTIFVKNYRKGEHQRVVEKIWSAIAKNKYVVSKL